MLELKMTQSFLFSPPTRPHKIVSTSSTLKYLTIVLGCASGAIRSLVFTFEKYVMLKSAILLTSYLLCPRSYVVSYISFYCTFFKNFDIFKVYW